MFIIIQQKLSYLKIRNYGKYSLGYNDLKVDFNFLIMLGTLPY